MKYGLVAVAVFSVAVAFNACTTYVPGEMKGGTEVGTMAGPGDSNRSLGSDKADGMGKPIAGGLQNVEPRKIYTQSDSSLTNVPY